MNLFVVVPLYLNDILVLLVTFIFWAIMRELC